MVCTKVGMDLTGVLLTFHGMVFFVQEGRFRQLLVKTCLALLIGWHVCALLLPFIGLGVVREAWTVRARTGRGGGTPAVTAGLSSRYLRLGAVAFFFGLTLLTGNLVNEYWTLNGETRLTELPSFRSARDDWTWTPPYRARLANDGLANEVAWPHFLEYQFHRLGRQSVPYAVSAAVDIGRWPTSPFPSRGILIAVVMCAGCLLGLGIVRHKLLVATLFLFGFCWALPMRYNAAFYEYEALFYTGIPLLFFSLALQALHRLGGSRLIVGLAWGALGIFVFSVVWMAAFGPTAEAAAFQRAVMADFKVVRHLTTGKTVFVPKARPGLETELELFYLAGRVFVAKPAQGLADFVVSATRKPGPTLLTPASRYIFLYA